MSDFPYKKQGKSSSIGNEKEGARKKEGREERKERMFLTYTSVVNKSASLNNAW